MIVDNHATAGDHIRLAPGSMVANKYQVVAEAGTGNFARVYEGFDVTKQRRVAIKLLKRGFENDANFECDVLSALGKLDPDGHRGVVIMIERFCWQGHSAIVFGLKGKPLRFHRMPMPREDISCVAKEVAEALSFLHFTARVVHTDLKPENILEELPGQARRWSICDLGSASFYTSVLDRDLITTRPYRAPEVVLNHGWSYAADTWSFGCILFELKTGKKLFDTNNDAEHLDAMQQRLGPMPPQFSIPRAGLRGFGRRLPTIAEELRGDVELLDLLSKLLCYEPGQRMKCSDVCHHPFVIRAADGCENTASVMGSSCADVTFARGEARAMPLQPMTDNIAAKGNAPATSSLQPLTSPAFSLAFVRAALPAPTVMASSQYLSNNSNSSRDASPPANHQLFTNRQHVVSVHQHTAAPSVSFAAANPHWGALPSSRFISPAAANSYSAFRY